MNSPMLSGGFVSFVMQLEALVESLRPGLVPFNWPMDLVKDRLQLLHYSRIENTVMLDIERAVLNVLALEG